MKTIAQIRAFLTEINPSKLLSQQTAYFTNYSYFLIENLYQDHRVVTKNDGFIALKGKVHDGHCYVGALVAKGVKLILVEDISLIHPKDVPFVIEITFLKSTLADLASWFYDDPSAQQHIFAVTGTNGKSLICHFLAQSLSRLKHKVGVLGTIGNGIFPKLEDSALTTLDNLSLQKNLKSFVVEGANMIAMEASSHAIIQQRILKVNIQTAIFSNLDVDHLDYHQTMEDYFQAKRQLFIRPSVKYCVINIDNDYGKCLYDELVKDKSKQTVSFSLIDKKADCYTPIKSISPQGFVVDVFFKNNKAQDMAIPIIGEYNISNIAAVLCALLVNGYPFARVLATLVFLDNPKGRLEQLTLISKPLVVIDYAHTADALAKALQAVRVQTKGKLYCVFGCGGSREHSKRPLMAKAAQQYADFVIVTEDNSRTDDIKDIVQDITSGFEDGFAEFMVIEERKQAIEYALSKANSEDVILLAGKGHETYIDKNHQKMHFDEREVVLDFWRKMIESLKSLALKLNECEYIGQDVAITGAHINSKEISQGQLFVALQGERDGHGFINDALNNGAVAVLVTKKQSELQVPQIIVKDTRKALFDLALIYRKTLNMPVLSITGSCGKTTTKEMLVCMLKAFGQVHYSHGNFNNDLGVPMTVLSTPQNADFVVIEAGTNAPGEISHLTQLIKPNYAGITNVSASHLEKLKSLNGVMIEKGALLQGVQPQGKAIINLDDPRINAFAKDLVVNQVTFSMSNTAADIYLYAQQESITALSFTVSVAKTCYEVQLNVIGMHNIQNTLTALSFIYALRLDIHKALNVLAEYQPYKGRFSLVSLNDYVTLIDDTYNASVQSVKAAINDLATFKGNKYLVLSNMGELGEHAEHYHQAVGRLIKQSSIDYVYLYGNKAWMTLLAKEAGDHARYFEHKNVLIEALQDDLNNKQNILSRILVKGSRANKMEEVVSALKNYYEM